MQFNVDSKTPFVLFKHTFSVGSINGVFFKLAPLRISSSKADRPSFFDEHGTLLNDGGGGGGVVPNEFPRCGRGGGSGGETKESPIISRCILKFFLTKFT